MDLSLDQSLGWYQKKISAYDKEAWERSVERRVLRGVGGLPKKAAKFKTGLIDVDLVRGSAFKKKKPRSSWLMLCTKGAIRALLLPLYFKWWAHYTSVEATIYFVVLYLAQLFSIYENMWRTPQEDFDILVIEVYCPLLLIASLGAIHEQMIVVKNVSSGGTTGNGGSTELVGSNNGDAAKRQRLQRGARQKLSAVTEPPGLRKETIKCQFRAEARGRESADLVCVFRDSSSRDNEDDDNDDDEPDINGGENRAVQPDKVCRQGVRTEPFHRPSNPSTCGCSCYCCSLRTEDQGERASSREDGDDSKESGLDSLDAAIANRRLSLEVCGTANLPDKDSSSSSSCPASPEANVSSHFLSLSSLSKSTAAATSGERDVCLSRNACCGKHDRTVCFLRWRSHVRREQHQQQQPEHQQRQRGAAAMASSDEEQWFIAKSLSEMTNLRQHRSMYHRSGAAIAASIRAPAAADAVTAGAVGVAAGANSSGGGYRRRSQRRSDGALYDLNHLRLAGSCKRDASDDEYGNKNSGCRGRVYCRGFSAESGGVSVAGVRRAGARSPVSWLAFDNGGLGDDERSEPEPVGRVQFSSEKESYSKNASKSVGRYGHLSFGRYSELGSSAHERKAVGRADRLRQQPMKQHQQHQQQELQEQQRQQHPQSDLEWPNLSQTDCNDLSSSSENGLLHSEEVSDDDDDLHGDDIAPLQCSTAVDKVSCTMWEHGECKKLELSIFDIASAIVRKVESWRHSHEYPLLALFFSFIGALYPLYFKFGAHCVSGLECLLRLMFVDIFSALTKTSLDAATTSAEQQNVTLSAQPAFITSDVFSSNLSLSFVLQRPNADTALFSSATAAAFAAVNLNEGLASFTAVVVILTCLVRFSLTAIFFYLLCVAERTFAQRFLYAKYFCQLTSARRAYRSELPHFRLNKVRNIKTWLSVRSYLKKHGPQQSVDAIVSTTFAIGVCVLSLFCGQLLRDGCSLERLFCWECAFWCLGIGVFMTRFMMLGLKINKKYRNHSILITEQINLYLHMEQKPQKKDELVLVNNVLKLAADLLKELENPFKISGICANPYLYNITKVVCVSAFSAALSEMLGFKLKLHKIKIK